MLFTIRHGQTDFNLNRIYSGRIDTPKLTKEAHELAYIRGQELGKYKIDIAFVSPLTRAKETFFEINKTLGIEYIIDKNLIERDFKGYDCKSFDLIDKSVYLDVNNQDKYDIETVDEMVKRIKKTLNYIKENYSNKNVLIVAHSQVCKVIKYIVEGEKETNLDNYKMDNLQIEIYKEW